MFSINKSNLIQLTQNLYRLTLLFPKKEPLRYKMREIADEILAKTCRDPSSANWAEGRPPPVLEELEVLDGFFEVAKNQNWVKPVEILRIQEEYDRVRAEIKKIPKRIPEKEITRVEPVPIRKESESVDVRRQHSVKGEMRMDERQQKILEVLREKGKAQVWQVKQVFPEVTKRTLRRDFGNLLKQGKIERIGERNETFYQLPTNYESKRITNKGRTMS